MILETWSENYTFFSVFRVLVQLLELSSFMSNIKALLCDLGGFARE